ncbi:rhomboid family intramembrane serine protease [Sphingobacterium sp. DN00404]|uniref:Rhomboid family intramembrane serine protease n=1 Tax=Sphingobacterium micropteri TaxID=2763501 RepID=A0ABR7YPJ6_9SPHI|nr:rhomboid family intramembrane serine protease [Sphingobacterium micropteri]MBD1433131.1 rhomboid family intramembrane serine protease [Sphingobacterium micropteri]
MKESVLKTFWRDTYQSKSPIPFIISVQVIIFVLIHLFDLLKEVNLLEVSLYDYAADYLSLPLSFSQFLTQPWSIITYPFLYTGLFQLLFDCLWLYWMGNIFLNFLNRRQFLFLYFSAIFLGACLYLGLGFIPILQNSVQLSFHTSTFALGAVVASVATLAPRYEVRLLLLGTVSLKTIALIYICIELVFTGLMNKAGGISFLATACWGILFIRSLHRGKDLSLLKWEKTIKKSKMKVVHQSKTASTTYSSYRHTSDLPNQAEIDEILDKISVGGYESLTSREKEVLFKASKDDK